MREGKKTKVITGNHGDKVRSDLSIELELTGSEGYDITINSKVKALYGKDIEDLVTKVLTHFDIKGATVKVNDKGALPFVIAARLEAAIKRVTDSDKEYLMDMLSTNQNVTEQDRIRFSRLYLPGNTPSLMINAGIHKPHGLILDLEDAVAVNKKYEARFLVRNALRNLNFYGAERMVRINQIPHGLEDLNYIVPHGANLIIVPKCETPDQIIQVNERIKEILKKSPANNPIWLMPIIESALGVIKAYDIASSAQNIVAMAIGLEDYTADLGTTRTEKGTESFYARSQIVNACRAAGVQPIDSVFSDVSDIEALKENVIQSKALGFDGMGCIHPRQIDVVNKYFAPDTKEIERSVKIVKAFDDATKKGLGVVSLGTKMIDQPVVKRALRCVNLAVNMGLLAKNWREENEKI